MVVFRKKGLTASIKFAALAAVMTATFLCGTSYAAVTDRPFFRAGPVVIVWGATGFFEDNWDAPVVSDFYLLDNVSPGAAGNDLITGDVYTVNFPFDPIHSDEAGWPFEINNPTFGGAYTSNPSFQVLDANDSYTAFGLDGSTDIDLLGNQQRFSWFFVTSNGAFDIYAEARNLVATGDFDTLDYDNMTYQLLVRSPASASIGQQSQNPSVGGAGVVLGNGGDTLADLSNGPVKVFDGGRKTARLNGTIAGQSVGFASVYRLQGAGVNGNNYDLSMGVGNLSADVVYTIYAP